MPTRTQSLRNLLVDFRVVISFVMFTSLIVFDLVMGWKPRAIFAAGEYQGLIGCLLVCAGLAVRSWAAGVLRKGKDLATDGPYSLCRHPLYLGSFLMMVGFCHIIGDPSNYLIIVLPIVAIYWATMRNEERRMVDRYGSRWTDYAAKTSRLIPFRWSRFAPGHWTVGQWLRNHEYRAVISSLVGLTGLELWRRLL
ncbi:MAG: isoprenylcysteine carboxylmethyltransferase family protein [Planctomycetia bacterium]|nr:isoprenylcysteine carboxylmethyltransferase family protein [Planctomycetia bacterium]